MAISTAFVAADWHIYLPKSMNELYVYSENQNIPIICYSGKNTEDIVIPESVQLFAVSKTDNKQYKIPVDISAFKKPVAHSKNIIANWAPKGEVKGDFELKLSYQVRQPNNEIVSHGSGSMLTVLKEGSCIQCFREKYPNTPGVVSAIAAENGEKPAEGLNGENKTQEIIGAGDNSCNIHGNKDAANEGEACDAGRKSAASSSSADFGNKNANSSSSGAFSSMQASNVLIFSLVILGLALF